MKFSKFIKSTKRITWIVVVLILTNLGTLLLLLNNNQTLQSFENPYPLLDISRNLIDQSNFIVNVQPLRESLEEIYDQYGRDNVAVYIEFLNSGANVVHNPDARYYPASLIKMPVAIAAVKKVEMGEWSWDSKLVIFNEDVDTKFGKIGEMPIGTRVTIETLVKEVLTNSDNTAYKMLLRNLGAGPVNDFLLDTGLNDFFDKDLSITAKEYTRLIRSLYTASYLKRPYAQKMLELMSQSERNYLGQAIPKEVSYSHKFGENVSEKIFADSGIVYLPNRPYIITVLYKAGPSEDKIIVDSFFNKVSSKVFNYFKEYGKE